jgi:hypothetical protein
MDSINTGNLNIECSEVDNVNITLDYFSSIKKLGKDLVKFLKAYKLINQEYMQKLQLFMANFERQFIMPKEKSNISQLMGLTSKISEIVNQNIESFDYSIKEIDSKLNDFSKLIKEKTELVNNTKNKFLESRNNLLCQHIEINKTKNIFINSISQTEKIIDTYYINKKRIQEHESGLEEQLTEEEYNLLKEKQKEQLEEMNNSIKLSKKYEDSHKGAIIANKEMQDIFIEDCKSCMDIIRNTSCEISDEIKNLVCSFLLLYKNEYKEPLYLIDKYINEFNLLEEQKEMDNIIISSYKNDNPLQYIEPSKYHLKSFSYLRQSNYLSKKDQGEQEQDQEQGLDLVNEDIIGNENDIINEDNKTDNNSKSSKKEKKEKKDKKDKKDKKKNKSVKIVNPDAIRRKYILNLEDGFEKMKYICDDSLVMTIKSLFDNFELVEKEDFNMEYEEGKNKTQKYVLKIISNMNSYPYAKEGIPESNKKGTEIIPDIEYKREELTFSEKSNLIELLDKHENRIIFLQKFSDYRAKGKFFICLKDYTVLSQLFNIICDKIKKDRDYHAAEMLIVLSQTYCLEEGNNRKYLQESFKDNKLFQEKSFWEEFLCYSINKEIMKTLKIDQKVKEDKEKSDYKYSNVVFSQILTLIDNMFQFDLDCEIIKEVLNPKISVYRLNDEFKQTINDIIEIKKEEKLKK